MSKHLRLPAHVAAPTEELSLKVILLGDSGVGKSSLVVRRVRGTFHPFQEPTIGASFVSTTETIEDDDHRVTLKLWDTAGQERFRSLTPLYFRGAHVALLVYDICRTHSFETLQEWAHQVQSYNPQILLVVVGTKSDLDAHRSVPTQTAKEFCSHIKAALYMETSAKENANVTELFQQVARRAWHMLPNHHNRQAQRARTSGSMGSPAHSGPHGTTTVDLTQSLAFHENRTTKSMCCG